MTSSDSWRPVRDGALDDKVDEKDFCSAWREIGLNFFHIKDPFHWESVMRSLPSRVVVARVVIILIVIASVSLSMSLAAKKTPPPPPPDPALMLATGLNIVTAERIAFPRLRAFGWDGSVGLDGSFVLDWTQPVTDASQVVLADVDGDRESEVVYPAVYSIGTRKVPLYGWFLRAYKQGESGIVYSAPSDPVNLLCESWAIAAGDILAYDLDGDGRDEVILGKESHIAVFDLPEGETEFIKIAEADFGEIGTELAGVPLIRRGLAIGDIDGGPAEIVAAGSYRNADREDVEYLLVFTFDAGTGSLALKASPLTEISGPDFTINDVRIADTDGDAKNEIWYSGWENLWDLGQYHQKVFSCTVTASGNKMTVAPGASIDFRLSDVLGPDLVTGDLNNDGRDEIVVSFAGRPGRLEVYQPGTGSSTLLAVEDYPDAVIHVEAIVGGAIFVRGTQLATINNQTVKGILLDCLKYSDPGALQSTWRYSDELDGNEIWGIAVGYGSK